MSQYGLPIYKIQSLIDDAVQEDGTPLNPDDPGNCPKCHADSVVEVDYSVRWNSVHSNGEPGEADVHLQDGDHQHLGFMCSSCFATLDGSDIDLSWT